MNKKKQTDKKKVVETKEAVKPKKTVAVKSVTAVADQLSDDEIRLRAYFKFISRGGNHGGHEYDWLEAEKELKKEKTVRKTNPKKKK
ncbi:MAG: DUF2934 domain-containing protein [Elusimicrobia bacterium]|nr:DUF2934 domain-containing protein [Elusimicrobiota bacterium]